MMLPARVISCCCFLPLVVIAITVMNLLPRPVLSFSCPVKRRPTPVKTLVYSSPTDTDILSLSQSTADEDSESFDGADDAIIHIKPKAMARLIELKQKRDNDPKSNVDPSSPLILRMGVRNGGCSGLSYVMDFSTEDEIQEEDEVDKYETEGIQCVVDAKSLLYLYGLELDYSDDLIGGGFKFFNPNAEESCGCGSSFGV
jgi:iron-sulfur cluster assembly protein